MHYQWNLLKISISDAVIANAIQGQTQQVIVTATANRKISLRFVCALRGSQPQLLFAPLIEDIVLSRLQSSHLYLGNYGLSRNIYGKFMWFN